MNILLGIFDRAKEEIFSLMESDSWKRFQKSPMYQNLVIEAIEYEKEQNSKRDKRSAMAMMSTTVCTSCKFPFNFVRRKELCSNCNSVICKQCSPRFMFISNTSKPSRVCIMCEQRDEIKTAVVKEGYLMKLGHNIKNWKIRYLVLLPDLTTSRAIAGGDTSSRLEVEDDGTVGELYYRPPVLMYFRSRYDQKPLGVVNLQSGTKVWTESEPPHSFTINIPRNNSSYDLHLVAPDRATRKVWLDTIQKTIKGCDKAALL